jgi:S-adenosylmethionine-diacylglycerol 3-amino-3-carboxypropyl transferase
MKILFDFGISQEDPLSEMLVMDIQANDRILSLASAGEVPLVLMALHNNIFVKAVDISETQVKLCRLKNTTAMHLEFPLNGQFLGYAKLGKKERNEIYQHQIRPELSSEDALFWDLNIRFIEKGIINAGRFEQYIRKMRFVANLIIGRNNLQKLIECKTLDEQIDVFNSRIATRKSLQLLFKIAFHPSVYKKRGLQEQALIHAGKTTGERFYRRFQYFCTSGLASQNYFLQFFLTGSCIKNEAFPEYLQPENKSRLVSNLERFELETISIQDAIREKGVGYYNKFHLSNIGDWLSEQQFIELKDLLKSYCLSDARMCYRFLQKNHFHSIPEDVFKIDHSLSELVMKKDRFPFYTILSITIQNKV